MKLYKEFSHLLNLGISDEIMNAKFVYYLGNKITKNTILVIFSETGPCFYRVHEIILEQSQYIFIVQKSDSWFYNEHLQAYKNHSVKATNRMFS